jgi:HAD superfamily hydrolase (TIGR01490 family)
MDHIFSEDRKTAKEQVVFFDLDRTIIREISGKAIVRMAWTKGLISLPELARAFYLNLLFMSRLRNPLSVIDDMAGWVKGMAESEMAELCMLVFSEVLFPSVFREARNEINIHKNNDATVIILSSALDFICSAMSDSLGMDGYLCSSLETKEGYLTGKPEGRICYGEEKLHRLTGYCAANNIYLSDLWYYSDSISDLPVLSYVGKPVCVNPDRKLRKEALKRGWKILYWDH